MIRTGIRRNVIEATRIETTIIEENEKTINSPDSWVITNYFVIKIRDINKERTLESKKRTRVTNIIVKKSKKVIRCIPKRAKKSNNTQISTHNYPFPQV